MHLPHILESLYRLHRHRLISSLHTAIAECGISLCILCQVHFPLWRLELLFGTVAGSGGLHRPNQREHEQRRHKYLDVSDVILKLQNVDDAFVSLS